MRVLVVGSGAREHAMAWKLSLGSESEAVHCFPGNVIMSGVCSKYRGDPSDFETIEEVCFSKGIDLIAVGLSLIHISEPTRPY